MTSQQSNTKELLPCPFCGGEAEIEQNSRNGYKLKCKECVVGITQKTIHKSMEWLKDRMIEYWNKRTASLPTERVWISVEDRIPDESMGRVLCWCEEINDLGTSHFFWNCSYSKLHGFTDNFKTYHVTHWKEVSPPN